MRRYYQFGYTVGEKFLDSLQECEKLYEMHLRTKCEYLSVHS